MHSFGRRVAVLGGTARGAKGQLVQYVSRLKGQMMSTLYRTLVCPPHPAGCRAESSWSKAAVPGLCSCLGFGADEALQAAPSAGVSWSPALLRRAVSLWGGPRPCPRALGPPCRPGSARTRSTATRCALQRRAQFSHGAKEPGGPGRFMRARERLVLPPGALARRACPPHCRAPARSSSCARPSCTPADCPCDHG